MAEGNAFAGRVARLRALMEERGYDAVVLRNNPDLRWLTGAERTFDEEVAHTAFVTADGLWLHTDSRYYNTFRERLGDDTPWQIDEELVDAPRWAARRTLAARARVVAVEDTATVGFLDAYLAECARASIAPATPRMHEDLATLRIVKDEEELALLREAQRITDAAFEHIVGYIRPGQTEQQIRMELERAMIEAGADGLSFSTIVASGPNGANPHAQPGQRRVGPGDMIVMDYGALYRDYHADMTRTVCLGEPDDEERRVYDLVRRANEACEVAARPGCVGRDIHNKAAAIIAEGGYDGFFKHGLGHGVGIQIHEKPLFNRSYQGQVPVGAVITVEPGVYLPGRFGVRLEDCGVMTREGYQPFGTSTHELVCIPC